MEFILATILLALSVEALQSNSVLKDFKVERVAPCKTEMDYPILFNCIVPNRPTANKVVMTGALVIKQNITGPVELKVKITRCNMDMSYCVNYDTIVAQTMCSKFIDKKSPWFFWADSFEPKFRCPLYENTYTIKNGSLDLGLIARLPIEGFHWILKFEFNEISKKNDNSEERSLPQSQLLMCLDSDITVRIPRNNRRKSWTLATKAPTDMIFDFI